MTISPEALGILCTALGAVIGFLLKKENRLTRIETKLDDLILEVGDMAFKYLQTPRSIAEEPERNKKRRNKNKISD